MIFCSAFRSFGESRAVFAVITVGAKRRIFFASSAASPDFAGCDDRLCGIPMTPIAKANRAIAVTNRLMLAMDCSLQILTVLQNLYERCRHQFVMRQSRQLHRFIFPYRAAVDCA